MPRVINKRTSNVKHPIMSFYTVISGKGKNLVVNLSKCYKLRGEWEVAVISSNISRNLESVASCEITQEKEHKKGSAFCTITPPIEKIYWLFTNVVDYTEVNGIPMQLLDIVNCTILKSVKPMYIKLLTKSLTNINVEIKSDPLKDEIEDLDSTIVLHFRKA